MNPAPPNARHELKNAMILEARDDVREGVGKVGGGHFWRKGMMVQCAYRQA